MVSIRSHSETLWSSLIRMRRSLTFLASALAMLALRTATLALPRGRLTRLRPAPGCPEQGSTPHCHCRSHSSARVAVRTMTTALTNQPSIMVMLMVMMTVTVAVMVMEPIAATVVVCLMVQTII
eukprot:Rmarinus@m.2782